MELNDAEVFRYLTSKTPEQLEHGERWHIKTEHEKFGIDAFWAAEFFCRLSGWFQTNKKFRVIMDFDPESRTEIEIKAVSSRNQ